MCALLRPGARIDRLYSLASRSPGGCGIPQESRRGDVEMKSRLIPPPSRAVSMPGRQVLQMLGSGFPVALVHASLRGLTAQGADTSTRSKTLQVNGVRLHYLEWGSDRARPIVLLHPAPLNAHVWDHLGPILAARFHVIAPDARGFGDSAWSDSYEGDVFLDDLHALIDALSLKQPILCGNSMGGTLAYMYAGLHPDLVERLITVDTGPGEPPPAI